MNFNWIQFADDDLKTARITFDEEIYNHTCFHSQQAIEKSLKGFLSFKNQQIPKDHHLLRLINTCIHIDNEFKKFKEECKIIDQYYIPTRYPDAIIGSKENGLPNKGDAEEAFDIACKIYSLVISKIEMSR